MAGLALGSWLAGRWARTRGDASPSTPLRAYAAAELAIAASAVLVPVGFDVGRRLLAAVHAGLSWGSSSYYVVSAAALSDDNPVNEYFLPRHLRKRWEGVPAPARAGGT
jgi:hypothetical protein